MGVLVCGGCDLPLFPSPTKHDSGTGWPSSWQPLPEDTLEELLGLHCSTSGYMSEADAREFAKDLGSRIKELNA